MLRDVVYSLFFLYFSNLEVAASHHGACPARLQKDFQKIIETAQKDKDFQAFLAESTQKQTAVLESKEFQEVVETFRVPQAQKQNSQDKSAPAEPIIFVSFSLGEKALLNLAHEAKIYGATLVLRGFKDNSYTQTVKALQKIIQETGQGFIIDPELFSLFAVTAVPTTILSRPFQFQTLERRQTPLHDRLQGHVSLHYALEKFTQEGELQEEAHSFLERAGKGGFQ